MAEFRVTWKEAQGGLELPTGELHLVVLAGAWVGIALVDQSGEPVAEAAYEVRQDDELVGAGKLGADGKVKVPGLAAGPCSVSFPEFDPAEWMENPQPASEGETYTIGPCEHLAAIAEKHGFRSLSTIWDHPNNAELKQQRKTPHVLRSGDQVFIPKRCEGSASCETGSFHQFTLKGEPLKLRIKLVSVTGDPWASLACTLTVDAVDTQVATDGDGLVEIVIPPRTQSATLQAGDVRYDLKVGGLDPIDSSTGLHARLRNLGYDLDSADDDCGVDEEQLRFALELFQHDNHLPITGEADDETQRMLEEAAGC